jgi:hypothetical protein
MKRNNNNMMSHDNHARNNMISNDNNSKCLSNHEHNNMISNNNMNCLSDSSLLSHSP